MQCGTTKRNLDPLQILPCFSVYDWWVFASLKVSKKQMQIYYDLLFFSCLTWWSLVQYLVRETWVLFFSLLLQLKAIETGIILLIVYIKYVFLEKVPDQTAAAPGTRQQIKFVERFSKLIKQNISHTYVKIRYLCLFHKSYS